MLLVLKLHFGEIQVTGGGWQVIEKSGMNKGSRDDPPGEELQ
jgi:hypothetical protein